MKAYQDQSGIHVLRIDRGECVRGAVEEYARRAGIVGARVEAIGALKDPELGYYWFGLPRWTRLNRSYRRRVFPGTWELAPLVGNLTLRDGVPFLHAHVTIGGPLYRSRTGHLFDATVGVTVEMFLTPLVTPLPRIPCEAIGLPHWEPGPTDA